MKKLRPVTVKLSEETYMKLRRASFELNITMQDMISEAIGDLLKKKNWSPDKKI